MDMPEFDAVLGGGTVPGSLTLVGGPPGAGKSTLLLQIAARLSRRGEVVYVCGEESAAQVKLRADRTLRGEDSRNLLIYPETNLRAVLDHVERRAPLAMVVDSIQTVWLPESEAYAGSITQIRDCTQALMEYSKRSGCATFIVGHVTKDGAIAGPRLLEHLVDTVLYFEGETSGEYRILRAYKNRFGSDRRNLRLFDARFGIARSRQSIGTLRRSESAASQRFLRRRIDRRLASGARRSPGARRRDQLRHRRGGSRITSTNSALR